MTILMWLPSPLRKTKAALLEAPMAQSPPPGPEIREDRENPKPGKKVCLNKELCCHSANSSGGGSTSAGSLGLWRWQLGSLSLW